MSEENQTVVETQAKHRRVWPRVVAGVLLVTGGALAGTAFNTYAGGGWQHGGGHGHHGPFDAERARDRAGHVLEYVAKTLDATEEQHRKMESIVGSFIESIEDDVTEHRATRKEFIALLSADVVDRDALQALRSQELSRAATVSDRTLSSLVELADVLTPAQRAEVREHLQRFRH